MFENYASDDLRSTAWADVLPPGMAQRANRLVEASYGVQKTVFPPRADVFAALRLTPPEAVKAVILGQDPYHEAGQANGLAFSVSRGVKKPPSLRNIFLELHDDLDVPIPKSGDLTAWAKNGVLLLNTSLTVAEGEPNTPEFIGWHAVTQSIIQATVNLPQPIVYLLWGKNALLLFRGLADGAGHINKIAFSSTHPSPLSAHRAAGGTPAFLGSRPFSKANTALTMMGEKPINWAL